jgi:hypothetical protein
VSTEPAPLVACPECKRSDGLVEQQLKPTWQPVYGLRADGDADDYSSFDYADDTYVVGYSCDCGWMELVDLRKGELERIGNRVEKILARMPTATDVEPD